MISSFFKYAALAVQDRTYGVTFILSALVYSIIMWQMIQIMHSGFFVV
jgi:hypothetical protein